MPSHPKGFTKVYTEEAVVRIWRNISKSFLGLKMPTGHFGHATMTVRGNVNGGSNMRTYISWWPSKTAFPDQKSLKKLVGFGKSLGYAERFYSSDKSAEMPDTTRGRLQIGSYRARPGQKQNSGSGAWEQSADIKIILPCFSIKDPKAWFGLCAQRIRAWWYYFRSKDQAYQLVSKTNNCAGVAAMALYAGGGGAYAPMPAPLMYMTPINIETWATAILKKLETINQRANWIAANFPLESEILTTVPAANEDIYSVKSFKALTTKAAKLGTMQYIYTTLGSFHKYPDWPPIDGAKMAQNTPILEKKLTALYSLVLRIHDHLTKTQNTTAYFDSLGPTINLAHMALAMTRYGVIDMPDGEDDDALAQVSGVGLEDTIISTLLDEMNAEGWE